MPPARASGVRSRPRREARVLDEGDRDGSSEAAPGYPAPAGTGACVDAPDRWPAPTPAPAPLVPLQRSIGNRAVGRLVQAKLTVGRPGDRFEREADRVADQVMRMPDGAAPAAITAAASGNAARAGRDSAGGGVVGGADGAGLAAAARPCGAGGAERRRRQPAAAGRARVLRAEARRRSVRGAPAHRAGRRRGGCRDWRQGLHPRPETSTSAAAVSRPRAARAGACSRTSWCTPSSRPAAAAA